MLRFSRISQDRVIALCIFATAFFKFTTIAANTRIITSYFRGISYNGVFRGSTAATARLIGFGHGGCLVLISHVLCLDFISDDIS